MDRSTLLHPEQAEVIQAFGSLEPVHPGLRDNIRHRSVVTLLAHTMALRDLYMEAAEAGGREPVSASLGPAQPGATADTGRRDQMFPALTAAEIARMRRFATLVQYRQGESVVTAGAAGPGILVLLDGVVRMTQRDGLGCLTPLVRHVPGEFIGEIGQLSGGPWLVDGVAEGDVTALLLRAEHLRALIIAEADLGERLMRALILRRVALLNAGPPVPC